MERGIRKRQGREDRHNARATRENEQMLEANKGIKIQCWEDPNKPNGWMIIRLNFKDPIIPQAYDQELRDVLEKVFNGYL